MRYRNASNETRVWPTLVDATTGRTLTLPPDGEAEIDGEVSDRTLVPVPPVSEPKPAKPAKSEEI